jgi:transposase-like protein
MVRPDRDRMSGWIEVDETLVGGAEEGVQGRQTARKSWVVIAAQVDGPGIGRIRMRLVPDCSAASLHPFVEDYIEPGSCLHTDGWQGYAGLEKKGYQREITNLSKDKEKASKLMPRVHRVAALLKRWLLGTHQGGVAYYYLPYYLDEFTFRFNRRKSASWGKLFFRLMQQAVATSPRTHESMVRAAQPKSLSVAAG